MWHVSSRSGVATLRTTIHLLLTYLAAREEIKYLRFFGGHFRPVVISCHIRLFSVCHRYAAAKIIHATYVLLGKVK